MSVDLIGIEGKVAIVTGGGRGAGRGIAIQLARAGARVAVCDLRSEPAEAVAQELRALGVCALGLVSDVRDANSIEEMVERVGNELGPVRILVNNVGNYGAHGPTPATGIEGPSLTASMSAAAIDAMRKSIPLGELCTPESLGDCVLMLVSRLARFVTGQTVMCDGGVSLTTQRAGVAVAERERQALGN